MNVLDSPPINLNYSYDFALQNRYSILSYYVEL